MNWDTALHLQLAAPALCIAAAIFIVACIEATKSYRARRTARRLAQAEKITVPHVELRLYKALEKLPR